MDKKALRKAQGTTQKLEIRKANKMCWKYFFF